MKAEPVLILGSGLTALGVLRSLARKGVRAYSVCHSNELAAKSRWHLPAPRFEGRVPGPGELREYLGALSFPSAVLFPCSDDWTRAVAELPEDLKSRFPASISCARVIAAMTDKWQFAELLEKLNIARPKTILVRSREELAALPDAAFEDMFLKPLDSQKFSGQTGSKAFQLASRRDALAIMNKLEQGGMGFPILLQEYVPGPANRYFLVDGFRDCKGESQALIARQRHRMYPAPFGNSTLSETIPLGQVEGAIDSLERIWATTKYRGIFDAEFKYDERDGKLKIVEINARPWWFVEFASRCGVNLCWMAYCDALGLPVEAVTTYPAGRRCVYGLYDFRAHRTAAPGLRGIPKWIGSLRGASEIVYSWDDPGPALALAQRVVRELSARAVRGLRSSFQPAATLLDT